MAPCAAPPFTGRGRSHTLLVRGLPMWLPHQSMSRTLHWRQLLPGLGALAAIAAVVLGVLLFAEVGAAKGDTIRIYTAIAAARGIMKGSEVWLHGKPVGVVEKIGFRPSSVPPEERLLLALEVGEQYRPFIRLDTDAQVRPGGSFIGAPVIYLTGGSSRARGVAPGDTIIAKPAADLEGIATEFSVASKELPFIMQNLRMINTQLRATTGTIGAFTADGGVELGGLQERGSRVARRFRSGGSLGLALGGRTALVARARGALSGVDSVRALLSSGRGELGRFRRDSTLIRTIGEMRDELAIVRALLDEPRGTAGRVVSDRAIRLELARADTAMQVLFADIKTRPMRYLRIF
jgi:hypothetical protein